MFEQFLNIAQSHLQSQMATNPQVQQLGVDPQQVAGVASESVLNTLSSQLQNGDTSGIAELLSGSDTSQNSPAVKGLLPAVASQLSSRLNIPPATAQALAAIAIPLILNLLNGRVNQAKQGGMDIGSLLGGLLGGNNNGGGLMGSVLGGMMGGKPTSQSTTHGSGQNILGGILGSLLK